MDPRFLSLASGAATAAVLGRTDINPQPNEVEPNNTTANANPGSANFASVSNVFHMGITGTISSSSDTDYYNIGTLQVGDILTVSETGYFSTRGTLFDALVELYRSNSGSPFLVTSDDDGGPGNDSLIHRFVIATTDTYIVRASRFSTEIGTYSLGIYLENTGAVPSTGGALTAEVEPNNTPLTANVFTSSWRSAQNLSRTAGSISAGDVDIYRFQFTAGDLVTVIADSTSSLKARLDLLGPHGIAWEDGTSSGPGNDSPLYAFIIPVTGEYFVNVRAVSGTGAYNADVYLSTATTLPANSPGTDLYSFTLAANQSVSLGLQALSSGNVDLAILDSGGVVQASGGTSATNVDETINNFVATAAGTYYARVLGNNLVNYNLFIVRGAAFDKEANDSFAVSQSLGSNRGSLGYIGGGNDDWYQFSVIANSAVTLISSTPGGGPNEFGNLLDPLIELYDPSNQLLVTDDNSAADGRNVLLTYTASTSGVYRARVRGVASSGEYFLSVTLTPAPVLTGITTDTGSSSSDGVTSDPTLILSGTAEAGSIVTVYKDGTSIGTVTASGAGAWSFDYTGTTLSAGSYAFKARAADLAGNTSGDSAVFTVVVDTSAPAAPALTAITTDTGSSGSDGVTSDPTLILSGTAEAGSIVTVYKDSTSIGTATASGAGAWSFDYTGTTLAAGSYAFKARAADLAGNTSGDSAVFTVVVDTSTMTPIITGITTDTGAGGSDGVTSDPTLILSGTAEAGSTVTVFKDGTSIGTTTASGAGAWSFDYTGTTLAAGSYAFKARAADLAGNTSGDSAVFTVVVDTSAPAAPTVTAITTDTGSSSSDGVTSDPTLILSGTAEAGSIVTVYKDGTSIGTASASGAGAWSFDYTGTTLAAGSYAFKAQATDLAGNTSGDSAVFTVVVDTSAPAAPTVTAITTDTGSSSSDGVTSDPTLILSGTAEAGSIVTVYKDGTSIGTATASGAGAWSFDYTGTTLSAGSYAFKAQATDLAGNTSGDSAAFTVVVDTSTMTPVITGITTDAGASGSDGVTSDPTLILSGTAEAASTVTVYKDGASIGTAMASGAGAWSFDYTGTTLAAGSYSFKARATDLAGNTSGDSAVFTVVVDTSAPAVPAVTAITTDTGASGSDGVTSDTTLVIAGTAEAGSTVTVYKDGTSIGTATASGAGTWSFDYTGTTLSAGSYAFKAQATDLAGNTSGDSAVFTVVVDTSAPAAPTVTAITTDTGGSGSDGVTSDPTLILSGTAEAGSIVTVYKDGTSIGTATASGAGTWTFDYTGTTLAAGGYAFKAQATDLAGNTGGDSSVFTVVVDTSAPAAPAVTAITTDTGASGSDGVTSDTTLVIAGTAEAASTVTVYKDGTSIGTAAASGAGAWSFDYTGTTLSAGSYAFKARATDLAGNTSGDSAVFTVVVDTSAPAAPALTAITTDTGSSGSDGVTSDTTLILSGTAEAGSIVTVYKDGTSIGTATASGAGTWTFDYTGTTLSAGSYAFKARATDLAGNTSGDSAVFTVIVDTSAPASPALTAITTDTGAGGIDGVTSDPTLILSGTAEAASTITVYQDGTSIGTTTASGAGVWNFDYTGTTLSAGSYAFKAQATDLAENTSGDSAVFTVVVDTSAPASPAVTAITTDTGSSGSDGVTSDTTLVIAGTAEAASTVTVFKDGTSIGTATASGAGAWTFDYTGTTLAAGSYAFKAQATDLAGNTSGDSAVFTVVVDTSTMTPVITGITTDTGSSGSDGVTSDPTLILSGTAEAGSTVSVYKDGTSIGTAMASGAGAWSFDYTGTALSAGSYAFKAQATDLAGNTSGDSAVFTVVVDTSAPAAPAVTAITTDTGSSGSDGVTSDTTLVIAGTAEAASTVTVYKDGTSIGTATASGAGAWTFDYTGTTLAAGSYAFKAQATDLAGNTSGDSAVFTVVVDTSTMTPVITGITTDTGSSGSDGVTSDPTLILSGTAEAGSTVSVYKDGTSIGTAMASGAGAWSFDYTGTALSAGSYAFKAQATDLAGNTSGDSAVFTVVVDTSAPAAPAVTAITTDTGSSGSDGVTSDTTLVIAGTAEAASTVTVYKDGTSIGTATASGAGAWTFDYTGTTLAAGSYAFKAQATDLAGNTSGDSAVFTVVVDTSTMTPVITGITTDTGSSGSDGVTSDPTLILSGTAEAGSTVSVYKDGASIGTTTASGTGVWSFDYTGTTLAAGSYAFKAQATDLAGNTSGDSLGFTVVVDTSTMTPVITGITTDTGSSGSDGVTSDPTLILSGTAEGGSTVTVYKDGASIGTTTASGAGVWSIDYTGTTLSAGSHAFKARATDLAGNISGDSADFTVFVDTSAPAAPAVTASTTDTGASSSDGVTSDATLILSGTAEAASTVTLYKDGTSIGTAAVSGAGVWSFDYTGTTLAAGSYAFKAQATDLAGNTSGDSADFTVFVDTSTMTPVITGITTDTGSSGSDGVTSDTTLILSGTAEAASTVTVYKDGASIGAATASGAGAWSFDYTGTTLAAGSYAFKARATDLAGNTSGDSADFTVVVDTSAPAAPAVTAITMDTGSSGSDGVTSDATLILSGTAEAASTVTVYKDGTSIGTAAASGAGTWSFDYTGTTLAAGSYAFKAQATDLAGNTSGDSAVFMVVVDTSAPAAPAVTAITTDTGVSGSDGVTSDITLILSGTAEAASTITVYKDGTSIGTATASGAGAWSFDYTGTTLAAGSYTFKARATDLAGNISGDSPVFAVVVDTSAPAAPAVTAIMTDTGSSGSDGVTSDATLILSGTAEAASTVTVYKDGTSIGTVAASGAGAWSFDYTGTTLSAGSYAFKAQATDLAGNTSGDSADFTVVVDTSAPAAPAVTAITTDTGVSGSDGVTSDTTLVIAGTAEAASTITVYKDRHEHWDRHGQRSRGLELRLHGNDAGCWFVRLQGPGHRPGREHQRRLGRLHGGRRHIGSGSPSRHGDHDGHRRQRQRRSHQRRHS